MSPALLLMLACAPESEPVEVAAEPPPPPPVPEDGTWTVQSRTVLLDECGGLLGDDVTEPGDDPDTFELWKDETEALFTLQITFDDGESYTMDCELDGEGGFTCVGGGPLYEVSDTTLSLHWDGGGELASDTALTAWLDATASCEGSLCDVAEAWLETELPCDGAIEMVADLQPDDTGGL